MKLLIDTSIWISFFSKGEHSILEEYIMENIVVTNDIILTELVPFLLHAKAEKTVNALNALEKIPLQIHWPSLIALQGLNLKLGINKFGIPDLIICQQTIQKV